MKLNVNSVVSINEGNDVNIFENLCMINFLVQILVQQKKIATHGTKNSNNQDPSCNYFLFMYKQEFYFDFINLKGFIHHVR